jgi:hypothetical protein
MVTDAINTQNQGNNHCPPRATIPAGRHDRSIV